VAIKHQLEILFITRGGLFPCFYCYTVGEHYYKSSERVQSLLIKRHVKKWKQATAYSM